MSRKGSGQDKVERILRKQPNVDTYVYERVTGCSSEFRVIESPKTLSSDRPITK